MIIRVLLLSLLALIGYSVFLRRNRMPVHIVAIFLILGLAGLAVVFPDSTTTVAQWVGVGRGVDLITYLVQVSLMFIVIHYYTKFVELQQQITTLVREIAILRGELAAHKKSNDRVNEP